MGVRGQKEMTGKFSPWGNYDGRAISRILPIISFGRVLPFRFGGQTIFSAFARAQPLAKFHGIEDNSRNDGMAIPRAGSPLGLVSTIELLVLGVGDQASRDIKAAQGNMRKRTLIWRGLLSRHFPL